MSVKSLFFTREALNNIKIPTEKQNIYRDTKEKGLFLIVKTYAMFDIMPMN